MSEPEEENKVNKENKEMTTKKDAQLSLEECICKEMMAQMMPPEQQGAGDACAEMITQFGRSQGDGECFEMMSQMMSVCCGSEKESDEKVRKA